MTKDVRQYVKNCDQCNKNKSGKNFKEPLIKTTTPEKAFDRVQIDTIGPLPKSASQNEYALTIVCELTKFLIIVAVPNKSAKTVAKAIVENCILIYGPVKEIITDNGTEFKNQILFEMCKLLKIEHKTSTPYHHQTLGVVERNHRTFNEYLRSYISTDKSDWDDWIKFFAFCYNTTPSTVHGYAPFELVYGKTPNVLEFLQTKNIDQIYNVEAYDKELKYRLQVAQKRAFDLIETAKLKSKNYYDTNAKPQKIHVNDMVFLKNDGSHKLDSVFRGPYQVLETDELGNCKIDMHSKKLIVHKNRLKLA